VLPEGRADIGVTAEWSGDLAAWYSDPGYVAAPVSDPVEGGNRLTFAGQATLSEQSRQFLRLVVTLN
jgi:hypothetical protein